MLRLTDNPPILPPGVESLKALAGTWWVAHTKPRFEKTLAWNLLHRGVGYFLPLVKRVRVSGGKKRHVLLPLFPSYLFFCGDDNDRYEAMTTNRLCRTLDVSDQEELVGELSAIEKALARRAALDLYPFAAVGRRCRVKAGPLRGLEGVVVRRDKRAHVVLQVSILGQGAAVDVDADLVESAE